MIQGVLAPFFMQTCSSISALVRVSVSNWIFMLVVLVLACYGFGPCMLDLLVLVLACTRASLFSKPVEEK